MKYEADRFAETASQPPEMIRARELYDFTEIEAEARSLIDNHQAIEHDHWQGETAINARTALFEALTAKGHLSRVELDEVSQANQLTLRRLLNGWSDDKPEWEKRRRYWEIVEELVFQRVSKDILDGQLSPDTMLITLSDFPEMADKETAHTHGYRWLNKKGMLRSHQLEINLDGSYQRVLEQISRSNSTSQNAVNTSEEMLANPLIVSRRLMPNGVVDMQQLLDEYAGPEVRYGEPNGRANQTLPDYDRLRATSAEREYQTEDYTAELDVYEAQINLRYHHGEISYDQKLSLLFEKREEIINRICLLAPEYALDARGAVAAKHFVAASGYMAAGNHSAGKASLAQAISSVDPTAAVVCGGNSTSESAQSQAAGAAERAKLLYQKANKDKKYWKWTKGYCVVPSCDFKNKRVEVGPCSVCRQCQKIFDGEAKADALKPIRDNWQLIKQQVAQERAAKNQLERLRQDRLEQERQQLANAA